MLIDTIKGYQICEIYKRRAGKENFGKGLTDIVAQEALKEEVLGTLKEEVLGTLKGKGRVFGTAFTETSWKEERR